MPTKEPLAVAALKTISEKNVSKEKDLELYKLSTMPIRDLTVIEILIFLRNRIYITAFFDTQQAIEGCIERFLFNQQWYRKRRGGKWRLVCFEKDVHWSPDNEFVDVMRYFGRIVDVLKTEDWTNG